MHINTEEDRLVVSLDLWCRAIDHSSQLGRFRTCNWLASPEVCRMRNRSRISPSCDEWKGKVQFQFEIDVLDLDHELEMNFTLNQFYRVEGQWHQTVWRYSTRKPSLQFCWDSPDHLCGHKGNKHVKIGTIVTEALFFQNTQTTICAI